MRPPHPVTYHKAKSFFQSLAFFIIKKYFFTHNELFGLNYQVSGSLFLGIITLVQPNFENKPFIVLSEALG
jgi:hypothetical protein